MPSDSLEHDFVSRPWNPWRNPERGSVMNAQAKIDDVSALAAEVRALRDEIRRLREATPQSLVDLKAAAAHLGVSTRTLRRWVDAVECLSAG
jgi:hypothetical protein